MGSTTPLKGYPFPTGTDRVMDGDDAIRKLAQSLDNMMQYATVSSGTLVAGQAVTVNYAWPIPFADVPFVVVSIQANAGTLQGGASAASLAPTAAGGQVVAQRTTGTAGFLVLILGFGKVVPVS